MVTGSNPVEGTLNFFNRLYKLMWLILIILIMFLYSNDRTVQLDDGTVKLESAFSNSPLFSLFIILLIIILTTISVLRALESRNEWRKIAKEDNTNQKLSSIEKEKRLKT